MTIDSITSNPLVVFPAAHRRGGVERVVHELLAFGGSSGRGPTFVGYELEPSIEGVRHQVLRHTHGPAPVRLSMQRRAMAQLLAAERPSVTLSGGANCPPGDLLIVGSVHRAWLGAGHAVTYRGVTLDGRVRQAHPWHRAMLRMERSYFTDPRFHLALACSAAVRDDLVEHYDVAPERIRVIPNGFSSRDFNPELRVNSRDRLRHEMGARPGEIALLLVANELHRKGLRTILDAMAQLADERLVLHVVGRAHHAPFEPVVERLGLAAQVRWHGPTSRVADFFAAADLLLLPARYEPFGLVVIEALASGLPVVVSQCAGAAAAVQTGQNGLTLSNPDDGEELADAIRRSIASNQLEVWSTNAAASVESYEWGNILPLIWALADEITAAGSGRYAGGGA